MGFFSKILGGNDSQTIAAAMRLSSSSGNIKEVP